MRFMFTFIIVFIWSVSSYLLIETTWIFLLTTLMGSCILIAVDLHLVNKEKRK